MSKNIVFSSEKIYNKTDEWRDAMREFYQIEIEKRINAFEKGYVFTAVDFRDIAETDPINKALSRLCENKKIRRIAQGIYDKPVYSQLLNEFNAPDINQFVLAIARKFNWTVAPSGETALNYLHLSTQVSNKWCYISDGPYRKYEIEPYIIEFKHCANKEISGRSHQTISVIQALKYIGKDNVQKEDLERLSRYLNKEDKQKILNESKNTTVWIYRLLKDVCAL